MDGGVTLLWMPSLLLWARMGLQGWDSHCFPSPEAFPTETGASGVSAASVMLRGDPAKGTARKQQGGEERE